MENKSIITQEINSREIFEANSLTVANLFEAENYLVSLNVHINLSSNAQIFIIRQIEDKKLYSKDFKNIYEWGKEFLGVSKSLISQYLSASNLLLDGAYSRYASNEGDFNAAQLVEMRPRKESKNKKELTISDVDEMIGKGVIHYATSPKEIRQIINDFLSKI